MKTNSLIGVRSNCNFSLHYQNGTLHPQTEIILITSAPKYVLDKKKTSFAKDMEVTEYRFVSDLEGINKLIGELQIVIENMNKFEQIGGSLNAIIKSHQENKKDVKLD